MTGYFAELSYVVLKGLGGVGKRAEKLGEKSSLGDSPITGLNGGVSMFDEEQSGTPGLVPDLSNRDHFAESRNGHQAAIVAIDEADEVFDADDLLPDPERAHSIPRSS